MAGKLVVLTGAKSSVVKAAVGSLIAKSGAPHVVKSVDHGVPKLKEGDVCLAMGTKALDLLKAQGLAPKNRQVGSLRGTVIDLGLGKALPTFDPNLPNIDYARKSDITWDVKLALRLLQTGGLKPKIGKYKWVESFRQAISDIKDRFEMSGSPIPISIDLETIGLDPYKDGMYIVSVSLTYKKGQSDLIKFNSPLENQPAYREMNDEGKYDQYMLNEDLWDQLNWLATTEMVKVYGANFKFDMLWIAAHWGIEVWDTFTMDTTLVGSMLDENRSNSLENHVKMYTDMGGYDSEMNKGFDKGRMDLVPDDVLLNYAGGDTDGGLQVAKIFRNKLIKDRLSLRFYKHLVHPATQAFRIIEQRGMVVDIDMYEDLRILVQAEIDEKQKFVLDMISGRIKAKYRDNLKLSRTSMLAEFLFTARGLNLKPMMKTPTGKISTAMEHFELLATRHDEVKPFVDAMRSYNSASKTMSTYIVGFLKHLRDDGLFHPSYMLHKGVYGNDKDDSGAGTGRTSTKDPAYQTIPKHTKWANPLRSVYVPPEGMAIMNVDYSQGELKIAACIAKEPTMIAAYKNGIDLHMLTGSSVFGMELDEVLDMQKNAKEGSFEEKKVKEIRQGGKAGNFGLLYGMQAPGFQDYARTTYGVHLTLEQAYEFREGYFERFPKILKWHKETIEFAHAHEKVVSPLGRVRHLPLINGRDFGVRSKQERQAINAGVQSTLSDLGLMSIGILSKRYPELWMFGFTHDAISAYVPVGEIPAWADRISEVMANLPLKEVFGWDHQLQFTVDVEVGLDNMANLKSLG